MALNTSNVDMAIKWTVENTVITGADPIKINDYLSLTFTPTRTNAAYNRLLRKTYSLAGAATQVVDLGSYTDDYNAGAAVTLTKACAIVISGTQAYTIGPNNAANPLNWIWGGSTQTLAFSANCGFVAFQETTFTTGSKLLITNTSGSTGTFQIAIIGGT